MNNNRNQQGQQEEQERPLEKNETLQDAGAAVTDYGRSGSPSETPGQQDQQAEEPVPLKNDETIGNP